MEQPRPDQEQEKSDAVEAPSIETLRDEAGALCQADMQLMAVQVSGGEMVSQEQAEALSDLAFVYEIFGYMIKEGVS
jgi:hypothetical protein